MTDTATTTSARVSVEISPDRLRAFLHLADEARENASARLTEDDVVQALKRTNIPIDDAVMDRVAAFIELATSGKPPQEDFVIVKGRAAYDGKDEELIWDESFQKEAQEWQDDSPVNYYTLNSIVTVEKDTLIGRIKPIDPPTDGIDVTGRVMPHRGTAKAIELDSQTLRRSPEDASRIITRTAGRVVQQENTLTVDEVLTIDGDVGFETGNIASKVDVHIKGGIPDRFEVRSKGAITVELAIDAALVQARGDVVVRQGILGHGSGLVSAEGEIVAKYCSEAHLIAKGDVKIGKQLIASDVCVGGRLLAAGASVIGGSLYAKDGVEAASLGSEANVPTRIIVGVRPEIVREIAVIHRAIGRVKELIDRIRELVRRVEVCGHQASPDQKKRLDELRGATRDARGRIRKDDERLQELHGQVYAGENPSVVVAHTIHSGVAVRVGDLEIVFSDAVKGPVSIEKRKTENVTELVMVNKMTAKVTVLKSERYPVETLLDGFDLDAVIDTTDRG